MKKVLLCIVTVVMILFIFSSCAATKRDCQGLKHYKLKNGIYL